MKSFHLHMIEGHNYITCSCSRSDCIASETGLYDNFLSNVQAIRLNESLVVAGLIEN